MYIYMHPRPSAMELSWCTIEDQITPLQSDIILMSSMLATRAVLLCRVCSIISWVLLGSAWAQNSNGVTTPENEA